MVYVGAARTRSVWDTGLRDIDCELRLAVVVKDEEYRDSLNRGVGLS